jgi:hypothetical protein
LVASPSVAQVPPDAVDKLRACSALAGLGRVECLDRLASDIGPPRTPTSQRADPESSLVTEWVVSETTSPVDYSPVAVATSVSTGNATGLAVSIRCRGGRSEFIVLTKPESVRRPEEYVLSYGINGATLVAMPLAVAVTGPGMALKVDPARFVDSLPGDGSLILRLTLAGGVAAAGQYAIGQLKAVAARIAASCHWPRQALQPDIEFVRSNRQRRP